MNATDPASSDTRVLPKNRMAGSTHHVDDFIPFAVGCGALVTA